MRRTRKYAPIDLTVDSGDKTDVCIIMTNPPTSPGRGSTAGGRADSKQGGSSQGSRSSHNNSSPDRRSSHARSFPRSRLSPGSRTSAETAMAVSAGNTTGAILHIQVPGQDTM